MREFSRIPGWNHKQNFFITKSAKKQFLLTNSWVITSILGVSGIELHSSGTDPVTFFGAQSSLGEHDSRLGGHKQWFWGVQSRNATVASGLLQIYSNLSNCNYRIFVKEVLHDFGFIEEMRTIWGNKEVPQIFFHNILYLRNYNLIHLIPYHCQPCIRNFVTLQKVILQKFLQTKKRDYQLIAVSSLAITKTENLAIVTGTCKPKLPVNLLIYSAPFVVLQNWEKQGCQ